MKDKIKVCTLFVIFVSIVIGIILGKIFTIPGVTMQKEINPLHAVSVFTTILVALVISIIFDREKEVNKTAKAVILSRLSNTFDILDSLNDKITKKQVELATVVASLKRLNSIVNCVYKQLKYKNINIKMAESHITEKTRALKELLTKTPIQNTKAGKNETIKVKDNVVYYDNQRISAIETNIEIIRNMFVEVQMQLIDS